MISFSFVAARKFGRRAPSNTVNGKRPLTSPSHAHGFQKTVILFNIHQIVLCYVLRYLSTSNYGAKPNLLRHI